MKDRVIYGALLMAGMLLCVFLSPVTRVVFFNPFGGEGPAGAWFLRFFRK